MKQFVLPDLGEGMSEAEIVEWHVAPGDHVVPDQPLVAVETDKAVVEVPAPRGGTIAELHAGIGEIVKVGAPLVTFAETGEALAGDKATVVGDLPQPGGPPRAAPAVRALARRLRVDLRALAGTGPDGAITLADVEAAAERVRTAATGPAWQRLQGARRSMAANMRRAGASVVPATVTEEADVSAWPPGTSPTVRLVRAIAAAVAVAPGLNAWFDPDRDARLLHPRLDLGIAVDTGDGLFVPVVRDAASLDEATLRQRLDAFKAAVERRSLEVAELRDATFTLSNFGTIAGLHASLVVLPPQVAILGAGRITDLPRSRRGKVAIARILPLSLTFDHRAVTGGEAARFLRAVVGALEQPPRDAER